MTATTDPVDDIWPDPVTGSCLNAHPQVIELKANLESLYNTAVGVSDPIPLGKLVGAYAFFDLDKEPLYVGQTKENFRTRVGRHLTGQRSDAVGKNILDPMEVVFIELWPYSTLREFDALEYSVYKHILINSTFASVFNEKKPRKPSTELMLPASIRLRLISADLARSVLSPDERIARRAHLLAELARSIGRREVDAGTRRVMLLQAERLVHLIKVSWLLNDL